MANHRTRHSARFKAKVGLAAVAGTKTLAEPASGYGVHFSQITRWKQELIASVPDLLSKGEKRSTTGPKRPSCTAGSASSRLRTIFYPIRPV